MPTDTKAADWDSHLEAWRVSGLSAAAYCRQHDLVYSRFIYHRRKADTALPADSRSATALVPVYRIEETPVTGVIIRFPGGISVEGVDETSLHWLPALVQALS